MSLFRNVISKLGNQVQQTAETVGQTVGQTVGRRVTQSLDAALSSKLGHAVGEAWQKTLAGVTPGLGSELPPLSAKEFEKQIRQRLKPHTNQHPFISRLRTGQLNQTQLHVWLANEWYFQQNLPLKDAAILSNCEDAAFRRMWTRRLLEQDGGDSGQGAVEHWAQLAASLGMDRDTLQDMALVTPGVRFAVDTYINFARRAPWTEAVCASLSEFMGADYLPAIFDALGTNHGKPDSDAVAFFTQRSAAHKKEWDAAMAALHGYFKTREDQDYALDILQFKQDILWTCLDSVSLSPMALADDSSEPVFPTIKGEPPQRTRRKKSAKSGSAAKANSSGAAQNGKSRSSSRGKTTEREPAQSARAQRGTSSANGAIDATDSTESAKNPPSHNAGSPT